MPDAPGPDRAFTPASLYEEQGEYVWNSLRRIGIADADLEDVTHEVFIAVLRSLSSYDPARPLRPWLFGITARVASHHRRRLFRRHEEPAETPEAVSEETGPHETIERHEARTLLLAALGRLSPGRRAVVILHELDDVPVPEIARGLGIPLNTAYSRLRLGRADLVDAVRRERKGAGR